MQKLWVFENSDVIEPIMRVKTWKYFPIAQQYPEMQHC